jgi:hypothetical protein
MNHGPKGGASSTAQDVAAYVAAAQRHGRATMAGDTRAADAAYREIVQRWDKLSASAAAWGPSFLALLTNDHAWVRLWAASHALHLDEARALEVLESLARVPGVLGTDARMTLDVWSREAQRALSSLS